MQHIFADELAYFLAVSRSWLGGKGKRLDKALDSLTAIDSSLTSLGDDEDSQLLTLSNTSQTIRTLSIVTEDHVFAKGDGTHTITLVPYKWVYHHHDRIIWNTNQLC